MNDLIGLAVIDFWSSVERFEYSCTDDPLCFVKLMFESGAVFHDASIDQLQEDLPFSSSDLMALFSNGQNAENVLEPSDSCASRQQMAAQFAAPPLPPSESHVCLVRNYNYL